jgi:hypothetical protein
MDHSRAVFWLGDLDKRYDQQASNGRFEEAELTGAKELPLVAESLHPKGDRRLIDEILRIFDGTLELFDQRDDFRTRVLIDRLALDVMSCVRCYVQAKARY